MKEEIDTNLEIIKKGEFTEEHKKNLAQMLKFAKLDKKSNEGKI